jgi:hypothetical protein
VEEERMKLNRTGIAGFCLLVVLSAAPVFAAEPTWGIQGGVSLANAKVDGVDASGVSTSQKTGFVAGIFIEIPVSDMFVIQPEANYAQRHFGVTVPGEPSITEKWDWIDASLLAKIKFDSTSDTHFYVVVGPRLAIKVRANAEQGGSTDDVKDQIKSTGFGGIGGVGVMFGTIGVEARYNLTFSNLNDTLNGTNGSSTLSVKDHAIEILATWGFK